MPTATEPNTRLRNRNNRMISRKCTSVAPLCTSSTTTSPTELSFLTYPLPGMAQQLPKLNARNASASSPTEEACSARYCRLCLNTAHIISRCNLVPEKLRILLINQRLASLLGLRLNDDISPTQHRKVPQHRKGGRVHIPCHRREALCYSGFRPFRAKDLFHNCSSSLQESNDRAQKCWAFRKISQSPDDVNYDRWKMVFGRKVVNRFVTTTRASDPINDDNVDGKTGTLFALIFWPSAVCSTNGQHRI